VLRRRVIPCLDVHAGRVVKGVRFLDLVDEGDPVELAARYVAEGADEICFLDITASHEDRETMLDIVHRTAENVFVPLTVGGGIRSVDDMRAALRAGADKVSVNSAAVARPQLIDAKRRKDGTGWDVYTHGGRLNTGIDAVAWAAEGARRGAGEILLTSMDRDGTYEGYDVELLEAVRAVTTIPVIASGGAGTVEHCIDALAPDRADAVLAASIFHRREIEIEDLKAGLDRAGIPVRRASA
jgi:cyclase